MKTKAFKIIGSTALAGIFILSLLIFLPRKYDVPRLEERTGVAYWDLTTGSRIAYTVIPARNKVNPVPVIYLHGGPGGRITDKIMEDLYPLSACGYAIYLYDQVGSGHSSRLENIEEYTAMRHKNDLEEIIKKIGADKVILIGQSWGAMLATLYMTYHPDKVEKAVFTGPGPVLPVQQKWAEIRAPDSLNLKAPLFSNKEGNEKAYNLRAKSTLRWAYVTGKKLMPDKEADDFFTFLNQELSRSTVRDPGNIKPYQGGGGYYAHIMTLKSFDDVPDDRSKLVNNKVPILIMRGQFDNQKWGYTSEYIQLFQSHKLVVIENAGHSISAEEPTAYLQTILDFLNN